MTVPASVFGNKTRDLLTMIVIVLVTMTNAYVIHIQFRSVDWLNPVYIH